MAFWTYSACCLLAVISNQTTIKLNDQVLTDHMDISHDEAMSQQKTGPFSMLEIPANIPLPHCVSPALSIKISESCYESLINTTACVVLF